MSSRKALLGIIAALAMPVQSSAHAEDITFLCAAALESWMHDVIPEFQKTRGHNVKPTFEAINRITEFVRRGDPADLAIVSPQQWESLQNEGKLDSTTRVVIAKVAYGVFVKKGAVKPDINSVEAFKRTFFNARSIALFDPATGGPTALFGARLFDRLGMAAELTLLWQFRLARFGEECLTVRASLGRRPCEEIEDGLPDGRHARLWRRSTDSFFSVPLL
jgi:molybdate transport system substrate-binding protein